MALGGEEGDLGQAPRDDRVEAHGARVVEDRAALDADAPRALDTAAAGSARSLGTLVTVIRPSRTATTSVKVPPTSTPIIRVVTAQRGEGPSSGAALALDRATGIAGT